MAGLKAPLALAASSRHCPVLGMVVGQGDLPRALGPWLGRQLHKQELERQKARTLQLSWKEQQVLRKTKPQKLDSTSPIPRKESEHPEEAVDAEKEVSRPTSGP